MTELQYERWKDFARRMVNVAVSARKRSPSRSHTLEIIEFFFECRMEPDEWKRVRSWDRTESETESEPGERWPMCVGSHISDITEYHVPGYWILPEGERGERIIERWMGPATCCIRAGLDMASEPSAGVVGFTAGDLRRMYPEGVPEWIFPPGERLHYWLTDKLNGTFAELPDDAGIVL